ncbi:hypothetical protein [Hymenobacter siberiensis]|uniref:hypothetical protein n=1 Tax=Hymenobacter siberiensis TaxID=2848396 RepID=UPI001C1E4B21|nr:hypothetical protein [Hymenobacter siberiensis]
MTSRVADATIKGYYYQFDTSILKLLKLKDDTDTIVVEGIEDIDIKTATDTTTVQCKYLSKTHYTPSTVREPIELMLAHFIKTSSTNPIKYTLYAHFTDEIPGTIKKLDISELKNLLTYKKGGVTKQFHVDNSIPNQQLDDFLNSFRFEFGYEFKTQQDYVISKIQEYFDCNEYEATTLYYNNSLKLVIDKSIEKLESNRIISKGVLNDLKKIKSTLYTEWFAKALTREKYLQKTRTHINQLRSLSPSKNKYILIGQEILTIKSASLTVASFIENIIDKYYKFGNCLRSAKPITIILDGNEQFIKETKIHLIEGNIILNDGYESLHFSKKVFLKEPMVQLTKSNTKINNASYQIRIISKITFDKNKSLAKSSDSFFNFSSNDLKLGSDEPKQLFNIPYCETIENVFKILN